MQGVERSLVAVEADLTNGVKDKFNICAGWLHLCVFVQWKKRFRLKPSA